MTAFIQFIALFLTFAAQVLAEESQKFEPEKKELVPKDGFPVEVQKIFQKMPLFEYYEPQKGKEWGTVPSTGIYPFETEATKEAFFRSTGEPLSTYSGYKYIVFYYDFPKNGEFRTKLGNPVFVPYVLLSPVDFNRAITNYVEIPVYNPALNKSIPIKAVRTFKAPIKLADPEKEGINNNMEGPKNKHQVGAKAPLSDADKAKVEELWRKKLVSKQKDKKAAEAFEAAQEYAKNHIDYWRAFEDRDLPLLDVLDSHQRSEVINGGYDLGINETLEYFKPEDVNSKEMKNSIMFPPMYANHPEMPKEAQTNFLDIEDGLIARIFPPMPKVQGSKWTFFFVAPTKFHFPDGKKIWLPVYTLVPYDSDEKPTDLRAFHTYRLKISIGLMKRNFIHVPVFEKPKWTPNSFEHMIMDTRMINMPQKPFDKAYYFTPEEFEQFLKNYKLINKGVSFRDTEIEQHLDPIKGFFKRIMKAFGQDGGIRKEFFRKTGGAQAKLRKAKEEAEKQRNREITGLKREHMSNMDKMNKRVNELNKKLNSMKSKIKDQDSALKGVKPSSSDTTPPGSSSKSNSASGSRSESAHEAPSTTESSSKSPEEKSSNRSGTSGLKK